jgi:hypothetical protein
MSTEIVQAKREAEAARQRLAATLAELQERLRPGTLASNAWEGVKDKSGELADDAMQAVKTRPVAVSAALAAFTLFLARAPIKSAVAGLLSGDGEEKEPRPARKVQPKKAARRRTSAKE